MYNKCETVAANLDILQSRKWWASPFSKIVALAIKDLYTSITTIKDVHPIPVERKGVRQVKLAGILSLASPLKEKPTTGREFDDAVVSITVADIEGAIRGLPLHRWDG